MKYVKSIKNRKAMLYAMVSSALLFQAPGICYAEEQDQFSFDQVVVTANRMPTRLDEAGANVTVITRSDIENKHYQTLAEALRNVNGVVVTSPGFAGGTNTLRLNGDDRVVVMVDGRRLNMDKGANTGRAGFDLNNLPTLANVERIEVVKGAASALYGSDAVGGVINIITRKGNEDHTAFTMDSGSWGTHNYNLVQEGREKEWSWFFTAGKSKQDHFAYKDFQTGQEKDMENSDYDKNSLTFRLDRQLDETRSLTLNVEHTGITAGQPGMIPGRSDWYGSLHSANNYLDSLTNNWALTYNFHQGLENPGYLRVYKNYFSSDMHLLQSGVWSDSSYNNKAMGVDWQNGWRLDAHHLLVGGLEWRDTKVENAGEYSGRSVSNKAAYVEDRIKLDAKWTVTPGVRVDHHNMFGSKTTPKAAVNYQMDDKTNMYVSWGRVFNAPNTDDLFWPDDGYTAGNPNLRPETGYTTTVGINKKLNDRTEITASAYKSQLNDAIDWAPDSSGTWRPSNVDKQRKEGAELAIKTMFSSHWSMETGYSYLKVENKYQDADYIPDPNNSQPNGYHIGINYTNQSWNIGFTGRGATGRSLANFTSSSYWVWDADMNYTFSKSVRGYLKVNNITNQAYEVNGNPVSNTGPGAYPMPGRNIQLGVQYQF